MTGRRAPTPTPTPTYHDMPCHVPAFLPPYTLRTPTPVPRTPHALVHLQPGPKHLLRRHTLLSRQLLQQHLLRSPCSTQNGGREEVRLRYDNGIQARTATRAYSRAFSCQERDKVRQWAREASTLHNCSSTFCGQPSRAQGGGRGRVRWRWENGVPARTATRARSRARVCNDHSNLRPWAKGCQQYTPVHACTRASGSLLQSARKRVHQGSPRPELAATSSYGG